MNCSPKRPSREASASPRKGKRTPKQCDGSGIGQTLAARPIFESDRVKLLNIFPEELWVIILGHVKATNDLLNIYHTSGCLQQIIEPQRTEFLFPSVWSILALHYHRNRTDDADYKTRVYQHRISDGRPEDKPRRWFANILNCRLVCKTWRSGIDNFYQSQNIFQNPAISQSDDDWFYEDYTTMATSLQRVLNCTLHFQHTHFEQNRNPYLGRRIHFSVMDNSEDEPLHLWGILKFALTDFGKHVWYFNLEIADHQQESRMPCYNKIKDLMERMPNLKTLNLKYIKMFHTTTVEEENREVVAQLEQLAQEIATDEGGLPTLPNLKTLVSSHVLAPVLKEILRANPQLSTVEIKGCNLHWWNEPYKFSEMQLANVKDLSLEIVSLEQCNVSENPGNGWNCVEKLKLEFAKEVNVNWTFVFKWIDSQCGKTVTEMELVVVKYETSSEEEVTEENPILINLKHLSLKVNTLSSLDFLLPLGHTLEYLSVQVDSCLLQNKSDTSKRRARIQTKHESFCTKENILKCSIWKSFPKLKQVEFLDPIPQETSTNRKQLANKWVITRNDLDKVQLIE